MNSPSKNLAIFSAGQRAGVFVDKHVPLNVKLVDTLLTLEIISGEMAAQAAI